MKFAGMIPAGFGVKSSKKTHDLSIPVECRVDNT
jgi:hypothetical protein